MDAEYISRAVSQITLRRTGEISVEGVETLLRSCAREVLREVTKSQLVEYVRKRLKSAISQNVRRPDHRGKVTSEDIAELVAGGKEAATAVGIAAGAITEEELETELRRLGEGEDSDAPWESDDWKRMVPGKRVLQKVAGTLVGEGNSIHLRNVVISLMARDGHKPSGMMETIRKALAYRREPTG